MITAPMADVGLGDWSVGIRTGDTSSAERAKQDRRYPTALITTPESLSLMLTREQALDELHSVHTVIVDEWHELMGTKRGVQVELALARLRYHTPMVRTWGLSATIGNIADATRAPPSTCSSRPNMSAIRSSGSANVSTPHPSTAVGISSGSTSAATATSCRQPCWTGCVPRR